MYLPSRHEDGGRTVSGLAELDVELGRRGWKTKRGQDWRYDIEELNQSSKLLYDDGQLFQMSNVNSVLNYKSGYWTFLVHSSYEFSSLLLPICILGFDELLTPAEKAKLYTAIGYSETDVNHNLPKNVSHFLPDTNLLSDAFFFVCLSLIQLY